jgi:hypothetical protein
VLSSICCNAGGATRGLQTQKEKGPRILPRAGKLYAERVPLEDPSLREGAHTGAHTHAGAGLGGAGGWIDGKRNIQAGKLHMHIYA